MQKPMTAKQRIAARSVMYTAALFGRLSLLIFVIFLYAGPFDVVGMKLSSKALLAWDALLSILFFIQHSGMIRRRFRSALAGRLPIHLHAAVFALASGVVLAVVVLFWQPSHILVFNLQGPLNWMFRGLFFIAAAGIAWGVWALDGLDPYGEGRIKAHLSGRPAKTYPFTVRGPYRWVRHPLYFFVLVMVWSQPGMTLDRLVFNLLWTGWIFIGTVFEEKDLVSDFGDAYRQYQRQVPMLIPGTRLGS